MIKDLNQILKLYEEYKAFINKIHSLYLDGLLGFEMILNDIKKEQDYIKDLFAKDNPMVGKKLVWDCVHFSHEQVFSKATLRSSDIPNGKSYGGSGMYSTTLGEMRTRNEPSGDNSMLLGNMCVVMLYEHWECHFRPVLNNAVGASKIPVPIWGDLRLLRNGILHNGKAKKDILKAEILKWYKPGDPIVIDQEKFRDIIFQLVVFGNELHSLSLPRTVIKFPTTGSADRTDKKTS